ncbi:MAG: cytochrome c biogenesis protein ResB [Proteobacteria bacterium]|nr:cytochrome c biogenesis protein ResB [Pseudomonadota bacterium]MBU4384245.1 cytochrome c biogenesis protein ResB [Pseudomonadota bacterium]MCG2766704.1 cytochrome c biogenesis protein ResB [Desulfarculaceae bacterium]
MSQDQPRKPMAERIWDFFASVKLSFFLLLLLAVLSIAGTLIPQKEGAAAYVRAYGEAGWRFISALGLNDLYHAPWFVLIMALLAANLVICSINRLSLTMRILGKDPVAEAGSMRKPKQSFTLPGEPASNLDKARQVLERLMGNSAQAKDGDRTVLFAQRGGWSRFGVYVVHTSVLVIMVGALVGNFWGYGGYVNIPVGSTVDHIILDNGQAKPLGFSLHLDKFNVAFYPNGMPSEYRSEVTFIDGGKPVQKSTLIVNDPAEYKGIDFYQSSYGNDLKAMEVELIRPDGAKQRLTLEAGKINELPGGAKAAIQGWRERVQMGAMYDGPVARILYQEAKGEPQAYTAFRPGVKMPQSGPMKFEIVKVQTEAYSGLQVKYDPGVWFIWVGCTLMVIGFFIAFYFSHRKVWLRLSPTGQGRTKLEIAGATNKNRQGLARLITRLSHELGGGPKKAE